MHFLEQLFLYLILLGAFLVIDLTWLGVLAKNFYRDQLGNMMADSVNWWAGVIFYLLFVVGLLVFVVNPAIAKESVGWCIGIGFFFGVITYSTYDLTNLSTLKDWPLKVTVVDLIWGGVLSASVSIVGFIVSRLLWG